MYDREILGNRMCAARKAAGYSIERASELVGCAINYLGRLERSVECNPSARILVGMAETYGVSVDYLVGKIEVS